MLDSDELSILSEITKWMAVNSEGIYSTRPWKVYGDGPSTQASSSKDSKFNEKNRKALTAEDVRFTTKGKTLYAFVMGWPEREAAIKSLGRSSSPGIGKIQQVELLGHRAPLKWTQDENGLNIELPEQKPSDYAVAFRVTSA
jgi:alpha-L-fucosidase